MLSHSPKSRVSGPDTVYPNKHPCLRLTTLFPVKISSARDTRSRLREINRRLDRLVEDLAPFWTLVVLVVPVAS